jgi:hypothetical protein
MPITLTVADPLASSLQCEAERRHLSVEQFALHVLGQAVQGADWPAVNRRRTTLIQLQADQHLELLDAQRLDDIARMQKAAARAINGTID